VTQKFASAKHMAQFDEFSQIARAEASPQTRSIMPETGSPAQQMSRFFVNQSFFDDVLRERAILPQRPNEPIVASTFKEEQVPGYAIGLHPASETPIAVQFKVGGQKTSSQALILRPGQIVRPHGQPKGVVDGSFSGFAWGLPFGWLGGGLATILVYQTPDADGAWIGNSEVAFHHSRYQIVAPGALPANAPTNWPLHFPWTQALQGAGSIIQTGKAAIAITSPTRLIMRLRLPSLAAPATMRFVFQVTSDFDRDGAGAPILTPVGFVEFTWPSYAASGGAGNLGTQFPYFELAGPIIRFGTDGDTPNPPLGGMQLMDTSGGALTGAFVDITRFGHI